MEKIGIYKFEEILKKRFPDGYWFYNPYLKQHVALGEGRTYFYDKDYNLLFKEPKLRYMREIQFVDEDLCFLKQMYSMTYLIYSMKKREIVERVPLRFPKKSGIEEPKRVYYVFYCKSINSLIFNLSYGNPTRYGVFAYNISNKKFTCIVPDGVQTEYCFDYKDRYAFYMSNHYVPNHVGGDELVVVNPDFSFKRAKLKIDKIQLALYEEKKKYMNFDEERGIIFFHDADDEFDGYMYYGDGTEFTAIDLDGNEQPWKPLRRYQKKLQTVKRSEIDFEDYIDKNGIDEYVAKNLSEEELEGTAEELLQSGYNWALNQIEQKAKTAGTELYDFLGNEQIAEVEGILYSVGWLQAEIENGGIEQYFSNGDKKEFDLLINALTAVGAVETAGVIKKGARMVANFNKKENPEMYERDKFYERLEKLGDDLTEDYAVLTIKYLVGKAQ